MIGPLDFATPKTSTPRGSAHQELENMLAAMGVAHGQRLEIDVLEVDQSTAAGSLEVEAAAAQQA